MNAKPSILLIMPDQMRGDCLSIDGHPVLLTPNMDAIGAQGARFTRAYTTCASCIPARRSLLTGLYPSSSGMVGYDDGYPIADPTLPQLLRDHGYFTALVGRNMHQSPDTEPYGYARQILGSTYIENDEYAAALERALPGAGGIRGIGLTLNGWNAKPWPYPEHLHPTSWVVQQARMLLAEHKENDPIFLTASFYAPHPPLIPPAAYMEQYLAMNLPPAAVGNWEKMPDPPGPGEDVDAHRTVLQGESLRIAQAGYFGLINHIDDRIQGLIADFQASCRKNGRPWVIVFTSDHGEMLGDHHFFRKCEPYEGSSRIPLLIRASPELNFLPGLANDYPVCLEDIMPTLLELAGIPAPDKIDGRSLVPLLKGGKQRPREILHGEHAPCYDREQAYHFLTDGRMKYIWRPHSGAEQLFDLGADPQELHDLLSRRDTSDLVARWRKRLIAILKDRPEGFVSGGRLVSGRPYKTALPQLAKCRGT